MGAKFVLEKLDEIELKEGLDCGQTNLTFFYRICELKAPALVNVGTTKRRISKICSGSSGKTGQNNSEASQN
ncbi:MAG TPA: hypothetical protein VEF04_04035 [Blastocatellia bacterium]|nr:hypothetical protein [Blastocatellia bacterium]